MITPETIQTAAIEMANQCGIMNLSRKELCTRLKIPDGSFLVLAGCTFTELIEAIRPKCKTGIKPKDNRRTSAALRTEYLLSLSMDVAEREGFNKLSRTLVAEECGVSESLLAYYFGTVPNFKRTVMRHAIQHERLRIIAEGLAIRDVHALKAPEELKTRALMSLSEGSSQSKD